MRLKVGDRVEFVKTHYGFDFDYGVVLTTPDRNTMCMVKCTDISRGYTADCWVSLSWMKLSPLSVVPDAELEEPAK